MKKEVKLVIVLLIFISVFVFLSYFYLNNENKEEIVEECQVDSDCIPASCCHAESCVSVNKKPDCEGIFCSAVCSGPLDCGAGSCKCINKKCEVIKNE